MKRSYLVKPMSTHGLAQKLENISKALRELPDLSLFALLSQLRVLSTGQTQRRRTTIAQTPPPPPRDPRLMEREELRTYLLNSTCFPYKADLVAFARRYEVPVNARTPREEVVRLCVRMLHDIPRGFTVLRFLAEQPEPSIAAPSPLVL